MDFIPPEIKVEIVQFLTIPDRFELISASNNIKDIIQDSWANLTLYDIPKTISNEGLWYFSKVRKIYIRNCKNVTDEGLRHLSNVHSVHILGSNMSITDEGLKHLSNVRSIVLSSSEELYHSVSAKYFTELKITDEGLKHLSHIKKIEIGSSNEITNVGLSYLTSAHKITISDCPLVTGDVFNKLHNLRSVVMKNCKIDDISWVSSEHLRNISFCKCSSLFSLNTIYLTGKNMVRITESFITDREIQNISNVHTLSLTFCYIVTGPGLGKLKGISILKIIYCDKVTSEGLRNLTNIKELHIYPSHHQTFHSEDLNYLRDKQAAKI